MEDEVPSRRISVSMQEIFMKLHALRRDRSIMKGTLVGEQSTFSLSFRGIFVKIHDI